MTILGDWRKSSYSGSGDGNACVEIAHRNTHIAVRDSKHRTYATLIFPRTAFATFISALKTTR
ncbi:hypothetical protein QFZ22_005739 [Streptomyces canus]|uniref:DUF397 domain-containing protein n=1 Tax=Streptomyces canus TaxID=58343 RepID=A0AAW8FI88_9ACTN|nr:DUF397 domain-containing protein [Streptomyces canus]MDQ0909754.1 hypothetical protein [Streptomyces canus]